MVEMLEEMKDTMIEEAQETRVSIGKVETIRNIQGLKDIIVELDVSLNKNLSKGEWKTIGEMTCLERLD